MIRTALSCLALVAALIPFRSHAENYLGYYTGIARAESLLVAGSYSASLSVYDSLGGSYAWNDPADCYIAAQIAVAAGEMQMGRRALIRGLCSGLPVSVVSRNPNLAPYLDDLHPHGISKAGLDSCETIYRNRINSEARQAALKLAKADQLFIHDRTLSGGKSPYGSDGHTLKRELRPLYDSLLGELIRITNEYGFPAERIAGTHGASDSLFKVGATTQYGWYLPVHHGSTWPRLKPLLYAELQKGNISPRLYGAIADFSDSSHFEVLPYMALRSCFYHWKERPCKSSVAQRLTAINASRAAIGLCSYEVLEHKERMKRAYDEWIAAGKKPDGLQHFDFIGVGWEGGR